jgi:DNA-binding MarR family transcriptional regulator
MLKSERNILESRNEIVASEENRRLEVWREVSNAWRQIAREGEKNLACLGLCMTEFKILRILQEDGPTPMTKLSDATVLTQPAITSFVDKLEEQGLVRREKNQEDRRVTRIAITPKGRLLLRRGLKIHSKFVRGLLSELDDAELSRFISIMKKLSRTALEPSLTMKESFGGGGKAMRQVTIGVSKERREAISDRKSLTGLTGSLQRVP